MYVFSPEPICRKVEYELGNEVAYCDVDEASRVKGGVLFGLVVLQHVSGEAEEAELPSVGEHAYFERPVFEQVPTLGGRLPLFDGHLQRKFALTGLVGFNLSRAQGAQEPGRVQSPVARACGGAVPLPSAVDFLPPGRPGPCTDAREVH